MATAYATWGYNGKSRLLLLLRYFTDRFIFIIYLIRQSLHIILFFYQIRTFSVSFKLNTSSLPFGMYYYHNYYGNNDGRESLLS